MALLATGVMAALSACGEAPLAERDPAGYKACSMYAESSASTDVETSLGGLFSVGKQARKAGTKAIRESAKPLFNEKALEASGQADDFPMVNAKKLKKACKDAGFEF